MWENYPRPYVVGKADIKKNKKQISKKIKNIVRPVIKQVMGSGFSRRIHQAFSPLIPIHSYAG
jgi:hypothetical protein